MPQRGAMLLEVIVSMGLLIFGMVMVGLQIQAGLDSARESDLGTRAVMLADSKMAELDAGVIQPSRIGDDEDLQGDFGIIAPGFTWRVTVEPTASLISNYFFLKLEIGYDSSQVRQQASDPTFRIEFDDPQRRTVRTVYRLWPRPADANPERDFGISAEQMDKFMEAMAGAMLGGDLADAGAESGLDLERMAELLSDLMQSYAETGSFDFAALTQLPEQEFMIIAQMLEVLYGRGGARAMENLKALFPQLAQQAGGGRGQSDAGAPGAGAPDEPVEAPETGQTGPGRDRPATGRRQR